MSDNWEHIIKIKLQNDAVTPPQSAWEAINDSAWTNKIKSKTQEASHPPVPKKLTQSVFQQNQIHTYLGGISLKAAAIVIGLTASALAIYTQTKNSQPQTEVTSNDINPQTEITSNSKPQTEATTNANNSQTEITSNSKPQTKETQTPSIPNSQLQTPITSNPNTQLTLTIPQTPNSQLPTPTTLNPKTLTNQTSYTLYSKSLTHSPLDPLNPLAPFPNFPQKKKSKPSHLKPNFTVHAGVQQRLNRLVYTHTKERGTYQHWPIQRNQGAILGLTLNDKWLLESGIFKANASSYLRIDKLPYYKTPIKVNPQRKVIEIHTPYHQIIIDAKDVALLPNGANWRDTSKYYTVSFEENQHAEFLEIPLSFGYKHTWHRFLFSAQVGGLILLPQKVQSDFKLTINNKENSSFEFNQEKRPLKNKALYEGFAQMQFGYYLIPQLNTYINVLLPGLHENNPNKVLSTQNIRFQLGLNYLF